MPLLATTVPAVVDALVQIGRTYLTDVTTYDGPPDTDNLADEFFCVGFSRDEDEASVDGSAGRGENLMTSESYTVHCILSVATGDTDDAAVSARRARCAALFAVLAARIRDDPALGGALQADGTASIGDFSWIYGQTNQGGGSYAEVEFDVVVTAGYLGAT